jgi:hypothetical protein
MTSYQKLHWQLFNALGRIAGCGFLLGGGVLCIWGLSLVADSKSTIAVNGVPTSDPWEKWIVVVGGLVVAALGVLLLRARRYRPDLGDTAFTRREKSVVEKTKFP